MKRLQKILPKETMIPEFCYFVFTPYGAIAYNGQVGIRYSLTKIGVKLSNLVTQHGSFAILDGLNFLKIAAVMEKITAAVIDTKKSTLRMESNDGKVKVEIPITLNIPESLSHLKIPWDMEGVQIPVEGLWEDVTNLITKEAETIWGEVVGVYGFKSTLASFDYGVLLIGKSQSTEQYSKTLFCPKSIIDLGLGDIKEATFGEDGIVLSGDDVQYYTSTLAAAEALKSALELRKGKKSGKEYNVALDFSAGVWKRAKTFNKAVISLYIRDGLMELKGDNWNEIIGKTDAPDGIFITRISLLQRWTVGTVGHKIYVDKENGTWIIYGTTRKESQFFGNLTEIDMSDTITEEQEEIVEGSLGDIFG